MSPSTSPSSTETRSTETDHHLNHAVLLGELSKSPETKPLPSGDVLLTFDLRVPSKPGLRQSIGPRQSIPVTWIGPADDMPNLDEERETLVVGEVHRRFYRGGGQLASRVDVRASVVVTATPGRVRRALSSVIRSLET